jgi:hypothetical protein
LSGQGRRRVPRRTMATSGQAPRGLPVPEA